MKPIKTSIVALLFTLCFLGIQVNAQTQEKPEVPVADLIAQGKTLYRTAKFRPALTKFEAALKQEPENDEALGLAAETAFRLDSQASAREYFTRRAELASQRESVKAYCFQRVAMTCWREAHDLIAKSAELKEGEIAYNLAEDAKSEAQTKIDEGLKHAERALELRHDFADAYNIRNLLYAEAALAAGSEEKAEEYRRKSLEDLHMALTMSRPESKNTDAADFNVPTIRISEFAQEKDGDEKLAGAMLKSIEGGRPVKRLAATFPSVRPSKTATDPKDPSGTGVTAEGGAYSLGTGRGALTAAYAPGKVKVEVLVSTDGKVIFTHVVDGRSDLNGAAIVAARSWTFEPAMLDGQPVQVSGVITFDMKPGRAKSAPAPAKTPAKKP
ncbi:MAG TPA: energy transducer TonB [Blastocatellia bacterium]|nr:energy transducer TonB [Blastocatellia bacterium]HMZ16799.1 energy transducer TonB [Blastocatellia bacterium]HNG30427.1 energy transducer TonB [Blastocatellia bacterium]